MAANPIPEAVRDVLTEALAWGATYGPVIPSHQWDEMRDRMVGQFAERLTAAQQQGQAVAWSDEQIIAACRAAGVRWIEPDGEKGGFPGGFDITHMPEMRRLFAALAQQPASGDGWVSVSDGLPEIDEPVWADLGASSVALLVRGEVDDGWAWCQTYGNVSGSNGKWVADDAEFDDDYRPVRWHRLPPLATQHQEPKP